jgi:hypothetical protein
MTEVVQCVKATGSHFFDTDTMRAFGSRLHDPVYVTKFGSFIVTSEKDKPYHGSFGYSPGAWGGQRRYTVRFVACRTIREHAHGYDYRTKRGGIADTSADAFGRFGSLDSARRFAKREQKRLAGLLIKDNPVLFDLSKEGDES